MGSEDKEIYPIMDAKKKMAQFMPSFLAGGAKSGQP